MHHLSARALREHFCRSELSAETIVETTLKRIERYDSEVGAFLSVLSERAREKARILDKKRKEGLPLGKLAGVPVAIKDNIHIHGELTTCASKFLQNWRAVFDSTVVRLLEAEDALIIGKTNLDEFAMGSSTENSAYQLTKNPWDLSCSPGGSSGGSAAAVAARFCPIALGSDTGGSIRQPAAFCGVTGFKPTYGRVSRYGLVAFASSLDQIGPITQNVSDAALAMEVLGQNCSFDATSLPIAGGQYLNQIDLEIQGTTIGIPSNIFENLNSGVKSCFQEAIDTFKAQGAKVVDVDLDLLRYSVAVYYILATAEASTNLARFDGIRYGKRSARAVTLDEVYDFSKQEGFGPEVKKRILLGTYVLSSGYKDAFYKKAQKVRTLMIEQFQKAYEKCQIIAMPTSPTSAFSLGAIQDPIEMYLQDIFTISANLAGLPAISIPCGFGQEGRPIGLQLIAPQLEDARVFQFARAFEKAAPQWNRIPPLFDKEI